MHKIDLPRRRLRGHAKRLMRWHEAVSSVESQHKIAKGILDIVCISDTHNNQPSLPQGDVLLHAGDLTENGSFDEVQQQLTWLASQPHRYKVVVAGNHDVLLDKSFLEHHPERRYNDSRTKSDLDWSDIIYVNDSFTDLHIGDRTLRIFGSPRTPRYVLSAFQHPPAEDIWTGQLPDKCDIVLTHGPPRLHLDNKPHTGCPYLGQEIARVKPRLVVFGHIHAGYGMEDVRYDKVREAYEAIEIGWSGWGGIAEMLFWILSYRILNVLGLGRAKKLTTLVNAALVGGPKNELRNQPVVVKL